MADALSMVSPVLLGLFLGVLLDRHFHSVPVFTLVLLLLGFLAGFWSIFRRSRDVR